jgi:hypothetical protein
MWPWGTLSLRLGVPIFTAMWAVKAVGVGVIGALIVGVAVGVIARILMRTVAISADHVGEFTMSGSIVIPLIYALAMIPGGIVAALTTRWWRWLVVGGGSAFLCLPAIGVASEEIGNTAGLSALRWVLLVITSTLVFATLALVAVMTVRTVDRLRHRGVTSTPSLRSV